MGLHLESVGSERRPSDRPALLHAALALLLVVGLSALVGRIGTDDGFSWELASVFGTAAGTTLLALATYWLAYSTRSEVRATQDLAQLTRQEQAGRERPVVLQENAVWNIELGSVPPKGHVNITLFNVGLGPALRVRVSATYVGHTDWHPTIESKTVPAIAPNEHEFVQLWTEFPVPVPEEGVVANGFRISGNYLDRSRTDEYTIITSWDEP